VIYKKQIGTQHIFNEMAAVMIRVVMITPEPNNYYYMFPWQLIVKKQLVNGSCWHYKESRQATLICVWGQVCFSYWCCRCIFAWSWRVHL